MSHCGTGVNFTKDCDFPQHGGTESDIMILDYDTVQAELASATPAIVFDGTTANLITQFAFTTASARKGFLVESNLNQIRPSIASVQKATGVFFAQTCIFQVADNKAATDKFVKEWSNKRVVLIYKNKFKNEDAAGKYKVFGLDNGLVLSAATLAAYENEGAWMLTFASDENTPEKFAQYTIFSTDEATTDAYWTDLQTAA